MVQLRAAKLTDPGLRRRRLGILLVLAAFILLMIGALLVNARLGDSLSQRHAPAHHALLYFKTDVALGHLWLEELILGSPQTSLEKVRALHASSLDILNSLIDGGLIDSSRYEPPANPASVAEYVELRDMLRELHVLAEERLLAGASSAAGSVADQRYNNLFERIMHTANMLEGRMASAMNADLAQFRQIQYGLVGACLLLLAGGGWLTSHQISRLGCEVEQRRRSEREAKAACDSARAANAAKDLLLAKVSHEIRTPISAAIGLTTMLRDTPLTKEQRNYIDTIDSETNGLLEIVDDLLDVSRATTGKLSLHPAPFDLRALVAETFDHHSQRALEKGLEADVVVAPEFPGQVVGDRVRIRQVLLNLLRNAIKFTDSGSVRLELAGAPAAPGGTAQALISVTDTGPGVPAEQQQCIFEAFNQGEESTARRHSGTGLGLAIARELVELMDGEIGLDSREGVGSRFWFRLSLPVVKAPEPAAGAARAGAACRGGCRVLVVEDHPVARLTAEHMLQGMGCVVDTATGGEEALAAWRQDHYDLIFLDWQMPDLDGPEVADTIRREEAVTEGRPVYIVAMTANAGGRDECLAAGMDDYLAKPATLADLRRVVMMAAAAQT